MRAFAIIVLASAASAQAAPPAARNTPEQIVCQLSGSCGGAQPDSSQQGRIGDERAFSLARPASGKTASVPPATARPATKSPPKPRTASGGLDMLIGFAMGSADLSPQGKAEARAFAQAMKAPALASMTFKVDGHTDAVGNRDYNLDLSKRRAQAVTAFLVAQGIDPARVDPQGYGFDRPRPGAAPRAAINRRVEFSRAN